MLYLLEIVSRRLQNYTSCAVLVLLIVIALAPSELHLLCSLGSVNCRCYGGLRLLIFRWLQNNTSCAVFGPLVDIFGVGLGAHPLRSWS